MLSVTHILSTFGIAGVVLIVFMETGLLVGVVLPGDSLLFTAGLLASQGELNLAGLLIGATAAAILGDQLGYVIGLNLGPRLFTRPDARVFKQAHLARAHLFFEGHGPKTVVLARFIPIIRTFVPTVAGAARMPYRQFLLYNIIGGAAWAIGVSLAGYTLGRTIPGIDRYLLPAIAVIVGLSLLPALLHLRSQRHGGSVSEPTE